MVAMTAIAAGSALVSAYGQYKSAQAQADAQRQQAQLNFLRAEEVLKRNEINNELLQESALVTAGLQKTQVVGSGIALSSSASRNIVQETFEKAAQQIELNNRAAEWEAEMTRLGAESQMSSANQIQTAGTISALGTLGFGVAKTVASMPGPGGQTPEVTTPGTGATPGPGQ